MNQAEQNQRNVSGGVAEFHLGSERNPSREENPSEEGVSESFVHVSVQRSGVGCIARLMAFDGVSGTFQ